VRFQGKRTGRSAVGAAEAAGRRRPQHARLAALRRPLRAAEARRGRRTDDLPDDRSLRHGVGGGAPPAHDRLPVHADPAAGRQGRPGGRQGVDRDEDHAGARRHHRPGELLQPAGHAERGAQSEITKDTKEGEGYEGARPRPRADNREPFTYNVRVHPLVIGVAGGSGSGKTTVVRKIVDALDDARVTVLEHDRYYRDRNDLRFEERLALNYDHPDSLETDLMVRHVQQLRAGESIDAPRYDFARFARMASTDTIGPRRALIVEGILIYTDAELRKLMDIKVFVDTDDDTRFIRRLQRDTKERG